MGSFQGDPPETRSLHQKQQMVLQARGLLRLDSCPSWEAARATRLRRKRSFKL
jgi:hypothetical protein